MPIFKLRGGQEGLAQLMSNDKERIKLIEIYIALGFGFGLYS